MRSGRKRRPRKAPEKMDSKTRVRKALNHEVPDRVPCGEFAIDFDTVERILGHETYVRAKAKSQIAFWEGRRDEVVQSWKEDGVALFEKLDFFDIINVQAIAFGIAPPKDYEPDPPRKIDEGTWEDREGRILRFSDVTHDITVVHDPTMWEREFHIEDFQQEPDDVPPDPSIFEAINHLIAHFGERKYILGGSGTSVGMILLGGMERGLMEYRMHPELVKAAGAQAYRKGVLDDRYYIRPGQDGVLWGQDYAYKAGPLISPEMFAEFVVPLTGKRVRHINETYGVPVWHHACGNNWALLDMFVEMGIVCYQSIQPTASMDIREVKAAYGDRLCLWGGVPVESLVSGTPDDVRRDVAYALDSAKQGGGYIFGSSHSIAVGTKYDNFMAMVDEFLKRRDY